MSLLLPFDFNPVAYEQSAGDPPTAYTVPAGKFAIIKATMNVKADCIIESATITGASITGNVTSDSETVVVELVLPSGAELSATLSKSSGTSNTSTAGVSLDRRGISTATLQVDSTQVAYCSVVSTGWCHCTVGGSRTLTSNGDADVVWEVSEYNNVT